MVHTRWKSFKERLDGPLLTAGKEIVEFQVK
jgi:hypothetical protein